MEDILTQDGERPKLNITKNEDYQKVRLWNDQGDDATLVSPDLF